MSSGLPFQPVKPIRGGRPMDALYERLAADPLWVTQAKLDGQRGIWDPDAPTSGNRGTLWSRRDLPIYSPAVLEVLNLVDDTIDGEYMSRKGHRGEGTYWCFDLPDARGPYSARWAKLVKLVRSLNAPGLVNLCPSGVDWAGVEANGWEGVVFKRLSSKYTKSMSATTTTADWVKYRAEWL